jgi:hypothetical protein
MSATVKLDAGLIDTAGNLTPGSMADLMDQKLTALVPYGVNEDPRGRRKLLLAIAQGVIEYLNQHEQAFVLPVPDGGGGTIDLEIRIDV